MLVALLRFLTGYLRIRIIGYSPERFLNLCSYHGICLWSLRPVDGAYEMNISVRGFRRLRPILRKTRIRTVIRRRVGLPFLLHRYRRRKLFFAGALCCAAVIYLCSLFVWDIHIEGNQVRTDETILSFLESRQVFCGMPIRDVDCARIVKDIRKEYDDVIWVSAYMQGARLMLRIKENSDSGQIPGEAGQGDEAGETDVPRDIVAAEDGVILEIITQSGVPQVHVGDEVKKGDLLVSGSVPVKDDAGETVGYQYQRARANITARTALAYEDAVPRSHIEKRWTGRRRIAVTLETGAKIWRLGSTGETFSDRTRLTGQFTPHIGGLSFPVTFGWELTREYEPVREKDTDRELQLALTGNFQRFCRDLEKKGVQILENDVKIYKESAKASARGTLTLSREIGEERRGEPPEADGQADPDARQEGNQ